MNKVFRILGWLEGLSLLVLLFIAMPMKYMAGEPAMVKTVGMIHGLLFMLYVVLAFNLGTEEEWPKKKIFLAVLFSALPFGTFYFEKKYLNPTAVAEASN